jgi:hypothetical protein
MKSQLSLKDYEAYEVYEDSEKSGFIKHVVVGILVFLAIFAVIVTCVDHSHQQKLDSAQKWQQLESESKERMSETPAQETLRHLRSIDEKLSK